MRAELKRCITTERRWNKKEVSRGSPVEVIKQRPPSHKCCRMSWSERLASDRLEEKLGGRTRREYFDSFLAEAIYHHHHHHHSEFEWTMERYLQTTHQDRRRGLRATGHRRTWVAMWATNRCSRTRPTRRSVPSSEALLLRWSSSDRHTRLLQTHTHTDRHRRGLTEIARLDIDGRSRLTLVCWMYVGVRVDCNKLSFTIK